ncbi:MAG TPA: hypothetical protein VI685_24635 [Candidatus Angelobacter sp.]
MDSTIAGALIGFVGSITAAIIAATYRTSPAPSPPRPRRWKFALIIILIAASVGTAIAFVGYDGTYHRLSQDLPEKNGYRKIIYDRVGIGFLLPNQWRVDDASFRFASGDIDLIRDYDPNAASISQGMKIRFLNVQENYVNNRTAEIENHRVTLQRIDRKESDYDTKIAGHDDAHRFVFTQSTGSRLAYVERNWIWLTERVKLEISSFTNLDQSTRSIFNEERDRILESLVIDNRKLSKLAARK